MMLRYNSAGVWNGAELKTAAYSLSQRTNSRWDLDVAWPNELPRPQIALPDLSFAPDFFTIGSFRFCSALCRNAMAQPEHVVQFVPITLEIGGEAARQQDYRWMRVIARQPAMDLDRSECKLEPRVDGLTGETYRHPAVVWRYVFTDGLVPHTEIFRMEESASRLLAVDALAARVLAAGCTGVQFQHPGMPCSGMHAQYYRTLTGMMAHRVGYLD